MTTEAQTVKKLLSKIAAPEIKVGDTLWEYDGMAAGGARWREEKIVGETRASWLIGGDAVQYRVNKTTMLQSHGANWGATHWMTVAQKEDKIFCDKWARNIGGVVSVCRDPIKLRQIAAIMGVKLNEGS